MTKLTSFIEAINSNEIVISDNSIPGTEHKLFTNKVFEDITIFAKDFEHIVFTNCIFKNVIFDCCEFESAYFIECDFTDCTFTKCYFFQVCFTGGILLTVQIISTKFSSTTFEKFKFNNVTSKDSEYRHINFKTNISYSVFTDMFYGCAFLKADLYHSSFKDSVFKHTSFYKSSFDTTQFTQEKVFSTNTFDSNTFYNMDFNPEIISLISVCPIEGEFIAYKKLDNYRIAKLKIPANAKRSCAGGRKCRANRVKVLDIFDASDFNIKYTEGVSLHDSNFIYIVGKYKTVKNYDDVWSTKCSTGIHFFMTLKEAREY